MDEMKFNFKGYDYDLTDAEKSEIYRSLMDIESHLTRHYENEDFGNDSMNFISVLISNNTEAYPISIQKWLNGMKPSEQTDFCLGNEKISRLLDKMISMSSLQIYATDDEIKDMFEDYLYKTYYPYYSGATKTVPTLDVLNPYFVENNKELIKAATCNGIIRNHMVKKRENLDKVFTAIEEISDSEAQK